MGWLKVWQFVLEHPGAVLQVVIVLLLIAVYRLIRLIINNHLHHMSGKIDTNKQTLDTMSTNIAGVREDVHHVRERVAKIEGHLDL